MNLRGLSPLPGAALLASGALLAGYLGFGGGDVRPMTVQNPCSAQALPATTTDLDRLSQNIVLLAARRTACTLGVSREELVLALPAHRERAALLRAQGRTEQEFQAALSAGLQSAVAELDDAGRLPTSSQLLDAYEAQIGLPGPLAAVASAIPDDLVDRSLPVDAILREAVQKLDVAAILSASGDPGALEREVRDAIASAVITQVEKAVGDLPPILRGLLP